MRFLRIYWKLQNNEKKIIEDKIKKVEFSLGSSSLAVFSRAKINYTAIWNCYLIREEKRREEREFKGVWCPHSEAELNASCSCLSIADQWRFRIRKKNG